MTIELFRAGKAYRGAALSLWQRVFGDPPEMISAFFDSAPFEQTCFAAMSGHTLAGMLFSLPAVFCLDGTANESRYLYAVATDPAFRGRGIMTALEAYACDTARAEGARFAALVPASPPLFSMYRKLGYRTFFFHAKTRIPREVKAEASLSPCKPEEFLACRCSLLASHSAAFEFYPSMCMFRYEDFLRSGGEIMLAETFSGPGYLAFHQEGGTLFIRETSLSRKALSHAAGALCRERDAARVFVEGTGGKSEPYGMLKSLFQEKGRKIPLKIDGYMGLMLN